MLSPEHEAGIGGFHGTLGSPHRSATVSATITDGSTSYDIYSGTRGGMLSPEHHHCDSNQFSRYSYQSPDGSTSYDIYSGTRGGTDLHHHCDSNQFSRYSYRVQPVSCIVCTTLIGECDRQNMHKTFIV